MTAFCFSIADAICEETDSTLRMTSPIALIELTNSQVASWISLICWAISLVAFAVCSASDFTSDATTAKPRPASPARAASIVALRANRLVWLAISLIRLVTAPTLPAASESFPIVAWALVEVETASMVRVRDR